MDNYTHPKAAKRLSTARRKAIRASLPQVCVRCGATEDLTLDHIVGRALGGTNQPSNLQLLCWPCNQAKNQLEMKEQADREVEEKRIRKQAKADYFRRQAAIASAAAHTGKSTYKTAAFLKSKH